MKAVEADKSRSAGVQEFYLAADVDAREAQWIAIDRAQKAKIAEFSKKRLGDGNHEHENDNDRVPFCGARCL